MRSTCIKSNPVKKDPPVNFMFFLGFAKTNSFIVWFSTIKRTPSFLDKKQAFHPFLDLFENEINRWGTTGESYSVPSTTLMRRRYAVHCHKEFCRFSSWIIDVPNSIRLTTTTTSNGKTQIKTDFVSNINETMLFVINHTQNDRLYCVRFSDTHIWSLMSLNEFLSAQMPIFLVPPANYSRNWNRFVIVESFHISTAYPHTHPNPCPHPHLNHP